MYKIKRADLSKFPKIPFGVKQILLENYEDYFSGVIYMLSLLQGNKHKSIADLKNNPAVNHLRWNFIEGLSEKDINFLIHFFFERKSNEVDFSDYVFHGPVTNKRWIRFLCFDWGKKSVAVELQKNDESIPLVDEKELKEEDKEELQETVDKKVIEDVIKEEKPGDIKDNKQD